LFLLNLLVLNQFLAEVGFLKNTRYILIQGNKKSKLEINMKLKKFIEKMSFKKLTSLALVIAIVLMIPITTQMMKQQTNITGRAYFEKPNPITPTPSQYGNAPIESPQITIVWPFLGKPGDSVLIYGVNFGNNPKEKSLMLESRIISEENFILWTPNLIEFQIPISYQESVYDNLKLTVNDQSSVWEHPFTIYSINTKTQISKLNNYLEIDNYPSYGQINIDFNDGSQIQAKIDNSISLPENKEIISLKLTNDKGNTIPFFVNPTEFGF
jgi:hypothetical protein